MGNRRGASLGRPNGERDERSAPVQGEEKHHEAMPYMQVGAFLASLREAAVPRSRWSFSP